MIRICVDDRIRIRAEDVPVLAREDLDRRFRHANPQRGKLGEPDEYRTWEEADGELTFPRGGMGKVRAALGAAGVAFGVEDRRTWRHPEPGFPDHLRTLRPYQDRLLDVALTRQNALLHGSTGSGKTTVLYGLLARLKRRSLVMVWTEQLLKQWRDRAVEELGLRPEDVGLIQGRAERIEPLTLAMQQTVYSRFANGDRSLAGTFDVVCCDEIQRMAAATCYGAVDPFESRYRVGVSADSSRKDEKEFLIHDLFGEPAGEVTEAETIAAGTTVDVEVWVVPTRHRAPWYRFRQDFQRLLDGMVADEERNAIAIRIAKSVVEQGEQVLLFTHRVEHARSLDAALVSMGIPSGVLVGGKRDALAFDRAKAGIKSGELRAAVGTYAAIGEGLDLPSVARGICVTPIGNNRQKVGQVRGRICRASDGKGFGRLYYLADEAVYGRKPVRNFVEWFRTVRVWDGSAWAEGGDWLARTRAA